MAKTLDKKKQQERADLKTREQFLNTFGGDLDSAQRLLGKGAVKAHRLFKGVDPFEELEHLAQADGKVMPYANRTVRRWALSCAAFGQGIPYRVQLEDGTYAEDWQFHPVSAKERLECIKLLSAMEGENLNTVTTTKIVVGTGIDRNPNDPQIEITTKTENNPFE